MLSEDKQLRLFGLVCRELKDSSFPIPESTENETSYTGRVLFPWLKNLVGELNEPDLYVRGDGGPEVIPVFWQGISFYPDLTIVSSNLKYLAFEVKFLREGDPGGALTKAIGQTFIYSHFGYSRSIGLIFDFRFPIGKHYAKSYEIPLDANRVALYFQAN